ncbi:unnamed protein product (macronuclear) [Paramecium tetraurelia]|uniref:Peptidase A1 domain-containing protein n=1 Tax=Paramecium tetraurelia TaxID=5888 RepID=A0CTH9_PARTE|nr:uncharacterized protein GSPATT00010330001 [Paramecium tetraurelia]CAK74096.1 unnamed protein product [Paramecium tetraurelia]|eukprot:XP_001441493.1 hypothetical protein (macronuclear) [Paramecium tetraurelia strain d4-2]
MFFIYIIQLLQVLGQDDDPIHTSIIHGSSDLGYYFVNIYVGNPPQRQSVIIDTGSSITAFPCDACDQTKSCGIHLDQYYIRNNSSTQEELDCKSQFGECTCLRCLNQQCIFSISYSEGSHLEGFYLKDQVIFGDLLMEANSVTSVFGCTTRETNLFKTQQANGIMGLSPKTNTSLAFPNIVDDIHTQHNGMNLFFAICIGRIDGYMTIGQYDYSRHQKNSAYYTIQYMHTQNKPVYGVKISQIKVHNKTILAGADLQSGGGSFIDSGSTLVNAHPDVTRALVNFFVCESANCPQMQFNDDLACYVYNKTLHGSFEQFISFFPTYQFIMENNFIFDWTPRDYLTKDMVQHDAYCLPVAGYSGSVRMILGQVWMRNWDIGFDKENLTLTFVRSNCSSDQLKHNFTADDWFQNELNQSNITVKTRYPPKNVDQEFLYEALKIVIVVLTSIIIIIFIVCIRKRNLSKQNKKGSKLPEAEDEAQKAVQKNVVVVQ